MRGDADPSAGTLIFMGDPQCSRLRGRKNDYTHWGRLLQRALGEAGAPSGEGDLSHRGVSSRGGERLLLLGGDLVNRGDDAEEWAAFLRAGGETLKTLPVLASPGNSDWIGFEDRARFFRLPANGPKGWERHFCSLDFGWAHVQVLDSNLMGSRRPGAVRLFQDWIRKDLEASRLPASIVLMHHPLWPAGDSRDDEDRALVMRKYYLPLFIDKGVDLILCGHQHLYCRRPGTAGEPVQIMGVSGSKFFKGNPGGDMAAVREDLATATILRLSGGRICARTIDGEGGEVDRMETALRPKDRRQDAPRPEQPDAPQPEQPGTRRKDARQPYPPDASQPYPPDPIRPGRRDGLSLCREGREIRFLTDAEIASMPRHRLAYSLMRRGRLSREMKEGVLLRDVIAFACRREEENLENGGEKLQFTSAEGLTMTLPLADLLSGRCFGGTGEPAAGQAGEPGGKPFPVAGVPVPPMLSAERDERAHCGYRLIAGQRDPGDHIGRIWMRNILAIDLLIPGGETAER